MSRRIWKLCVASLLIILCFPAGDDNLGYPSLWQCERFGLTILSHSLFILLLWLVKHLESRHNQQSSRWSPEDANTWQSGGHPAYLGRISETNLKHLVMILTIIVLITSIGIVSWFEYMSSTQWLRYSLSLTQSPFWHFTVEFIVTFVRLTKSSNFVCCREEPS